MQSPDAVAMQTSVVDAKLQSPVLHGNKLGCKRRLEDVPQLSGATPNPGKLSRGESSEGGALQAVGKPKAELVLDDGTRWQGTPFGADCGISGEVVFNTAMVGYPEALTDPSYRGQLLVLTFPLIGNYGVPSDQKDDLGLSLYFESANIHISALIVSEYSSDSAHWNLDQSLGAWLKKAGVPAIYGVDTRALTKHIRERGAMLGKILPPGGADADVPQIDPNKLNLVAQVSLKKPQLFVSHAPPMLNMKGERMRIVAVDCGIKARARPPAPAPFPRHSPTARSSPRDRRRTSSGTS